MQAGCENFVPERITDDLCFKCVGYTENQYIVPEGSPYARLRQGLACQNGMEVLLGQPPQSLRMDFTKTRRQAMAVKQLKNR